MRVIHLVNYIHRNGDIILYIVTCIFTIFMLEVA